MKSGTWPCSLLYRVALFKDLAELWAWCCNLSPPLQEVCSVKVWVGYTGNNTPVQDRVYSYLSSFIFMVVTLYVYIVCLWILTFSSWTDAGGHAFEYLKSELHSRFRQEIQDFQAEKFWSLEQGCRFVIKKSIMSKNISGFVDDLYVEGSLMFQSSLSPGLWCSDLYHKHTRIHLPFISFDIWGAYSVSAVQTPPPHVFIFC